MEFPKKNRIVLLVILYLIALVKAGDINEEKKAAVKKLDTLVENTKKLFDKTSADIEKAQENLEIITDRGREFGENIFLHKRAFIRRTTTNANIKANHMHCSREAFRCFEISEIVAIEEIGDYLVYKFLAVIDDTEGKAEAEHRKFVKTWKDDCSKAGNQYSSTYKNAVSEIQKATSESAISSVVRNFEKATEQIAEVIRGVVTKMNNVDIVVQKTVDQLAKNLEHYMRDRVDVKQTEYTKACFDHC